KGGGACDHHNALSDPQKASCNQLLNDATNRVDNLDAGRTAGWVAAGVGGAILITGVLLVATAPNPHRYDEKPVEPFIAGWRIVPAVGPGGGSMTLTGRF